MSPTVTLYDSDTLARSFTYRTQTIQRRRGTEEDRVKYIVPVDVKRITEVVHVKGNTYLNVVMRDGSNRTIPAVTR